MSQLTLLVGPPGSGKSTLAKSLIHNDGDHGAATVYVNQDSQGPAGHKDIFIDAVYAGKDIIVDRMNFNVQQRRTYIEIAKLKGYRVKVIIKCESQETCLARMLARQGHETIKDERGARSAMQTFFTKYEPPDHSEDIDEIVRLYPDNAKLPCIVVDLDGTLCDVEHRRHFVRRPQGEKKDWRSFFLGIADDEPNRWCTDLVRRYAKDHCIVFCTGRDENHKKPTVDWLEKHMGWAPNQGHYSLFMRHRHDSRQDYMVKEILLDFEILTRFKPFFMVDDRKQVVDMWRRRGFVCLQCDEGEF
jgi:predicted kinase